MLKTYWLKWEIYNNLMIENFSIEIFMASFIYSIHIIFHTVPDTHLDPSDTGKSKTDEATGLTGGD